MNVAVQPRSAQSLASDPLASAFVTANAGTGKTFTLVARVARLLLHGARPEAILCVTYTKAAAAEMQRRLFDELGAWSVMADEALRRALARIDERPDDLSEARTLFARALETPGGLKITTIHAFCEKLLRRFPLEAGVSPGFTVLEDAAAAEVSERAGEMLALAAAAEPERSMALAYAHFAVELDHGAFQALFASFEAERRSIETYFDACDGDVAADVWTVCGFDGEPADPDALEAEAASACEWASWRRAAEVLLASGAKTDRALGEGLARLAECAASGPAGFGDCWALFSTDKGEPSKRLGTKGLDPEIAQWLQDEQARLHAVCKRAKAARVARDTVHALTLAHAYAALYEGEKLARGGLDFADLIGGALALLTVRADAAWVLYKLDGGIDHVLVDEAQDTAPEQWEILRALTEEFFAGAGAHDAGMRALVRTVFAVGDEKQSIYSFQGARPEQLPEQTAAFEALALAGGRKFVRPALIDSWRSTTQVLSFVDAVFADPATREAVPPTRDEAMLRHRPLRTADAGSVELWPLFKDERQDEPDAWDAPLDLQPPESARKRLARSVAEAVCGLAARGEAVFDKATDAWRPGGPGDVLVLVRRRDALFEEIIRALKKAGIPVAGADRLRLSDHVVFQDLLALARFALFPWDDLTLAALLRSPFCDVDEDQLYDLAQPREGRSLWGELGGRGGERPEWAAALAFLTWAMEEATRRSPFDWLGRVLSRLDREGRSMRQRILTRLGREAEDALDEVLAQALAAEARGVADLERFVAAMERVDIQVKRELEAPKGEVRVMTVHGAKGLEAPIVILPDTTARLPAPRNGLLKTERGGFLFAPRARDDCEASAEARAAQVRRTEAESLRLLYVAMTRARDRLIVAGRISARDTAGAKGCWYERVEAAFGRPEIAEHARIVEQGALQVQRFGPDPRLAATDAAAVSATALLPAWSRSLAPAEPPAMVYAAPSTLLEEVRGPAPSPLVARAGLGRYRRGALIHRLLQLLPDLAPESRPAAAHRLLAREAELTAAQREEMAAAALGVLSDPVFAQVFAPGSRAEAAIAGTSPELPPGLAISGRVDRMWVGADAVLVVDFKTNRPAPATIEVADDAYVLQMAIYAAVLRPVFPDRRVEAALVWTDGPSLMPVPEAVMAQALVKLGQGG